MHVYSIKDLYPLALAEGEGVGTAYEYFAKRLELIPWLKRYPHPQTILVAGIPEKYGASLDFLLLAAEIGASVTVVDDRPPALQKAEDAVETAQSQGLLNNLQPDFRLVTDLHLMADVLGPFDLILCSETIQRIPDGDRSAYLSGLLQMSSHLALFMPNDDNPAHTNQSGLTGLRFDELQELIIQSSEQQNLSAAQLSVESGYIDMPPFPPGITRTEEQREQATSGRSEAIAMWGLGYFARMERFFPLGWRKGKAHIVYALISSSPR